MDHLTEQDAGLLEQAASMLEGLANDERNRGNCSSSEGAACSAHAIRRLAPAMLRAGHGCLAQIEEPAHTWPAGLLERVKSALERIENNHCIRRIPADPTDPDLVLAEVRYLLEGKTPPFWVSKLPQGAAPAAVAPQGERQWICPTRTVADLVNNLLTMDQALPIYGAQYIEKDGRRRAIAVPPTVSRERVKDGRWIGQGEELNAAVVWTRAEQPAAVAGPADDLAELAMLNKLVELGTQAYGALAKSNSDDGPAGTAAYVRWQERRAEMGELIRAHKAPALEAPAAPESEPWCPDVCPITGRPFFMWIDHWQTGKPVPTYGGPYDSYTIPEKDDEDAFECERYDHDAGEWMTEGMGWYSTGMKLVDDQSFIVHPSNPRYNEIEAFAAAAPQDPSAAKGEHEAHSSTQTWPAWWAHNREKCTTPRKAALAAWNYANERALHAMVANPAPAGDLAADVEAVLGLLEEHEWAEHCTKTPLGQRLEAAITELHNEIHAAEDAPYAAAPAVTIDPASFEGLINAVRSLPTTRATEFDGEESDGTPQRWRNRPFVSRTQLERLLRDRVAAPAAPAVDAKAHDWRENASYGGEICAECGAANGSRRGNAPCAWPPEPLDVCTDPYNCARCKTHPAHRGDMHHAGISGKVGSA